MVTFKKSLSNIIFFSGVALYFIIFYMIHINFNGSKTVMKDKESYKVRRPQVGINSSKKSGRIYWAKNGVKFFLRQKPKPIDLPRCHIEIWGKADISGYLWYHILEGESQAYDNDTKILGNIVLQNLHFQYRFGPGIQPRTVPKSVQNLVLVINGREEKKIKKAKFWLQSLVNFKSLRKIALVLLGDEKCNNDWLLPYMKSRGGIVDIVFITYDTTIIDNKEFFQWPLGVAMYRNFKNIKSNEINVNTSREFPCNFLGSIYPNTSRVLLQEILEKSNVCFLRTRKIYEESETAVSMKMYVNALNNSDLTLNPVGENTECYRIYEAFSLGSVPVVENVVTPGQCDSYSSNTPLRLLKEYNAPMILIEDWRDLNSLLETESKLDFKFKVERRKRLIKWYKDFKMKMRNKFLAILRKSFCSKE